MDPRPIRRGRGRRAGAAAQAPRAGAAPSSDPRAVRLGCWPPCSAQKVTPTARAPQATSWFDADRSMDHLAGPSFFDGRTNTAAGRAQARVAGRPRALRAPLRPTGSMDWLDWRFSHMVSCKQQLHTCVRMWCGLWCHWRPFSFESCVFVQQPTPAQCAQHPAPRARVGHVRDRPETSRGKRGRQRPSARTRLTTHTTHRTQESRAERTRLL